MLLCRWCGDTRLCFQFAIEKVNISHLVPSQNIVMGINSSNSDIASSTHAFIRMIILWNGLFMSSTSPSEAWDCFPVYVVRSLLLGWAQTPQDAETWRNEKRARGRTDIRPGWGNATLEANLHHWNHRTHAMRFWIARNMNPLRTNF